MVATDVGAVSDVVPPETGCLVAAADPEPLAAGIAALLDDAPRRQAMGRQGRERMVARFSWPVAARHTLRVYRQVLSGCPVQDQVE